MFGVIDESDESGVFDVYDCNDGCNDGCNDDCNDGCNDYM